MKKVAIYARVSTSHQSTKLQLDELNRYVELREWVQTDIFEDTSTGTNTSRSGFKSLMKAARFEELGISLVSLKDQIDLTTSTGRLMVHLIGAFAQFETDLIRSRVKAGIEKARAEGKVLGRPRLNKEAEILELRSKGYSYQKIQMKLGVSKGAVWRAIKKSEGN